jgi:transposase
LGTRVVVCKPADPEAKGPIERCHDYLERSFLPGRAFASPADFNAQLQQGLAVVNARPRRALGCAPADRITADRQAMLALPPVAPATGWRFSGRLARDHYVRLDSNDYSVHPAVIGRRIEVIAGLDRVRVVWGGRAVADHERAWSWHQTITDPEHLAAARAMRSQRARVLRPAPEPDVEERSLAVYDAVLGTGADGGAARRRTARQYLGHGEQAQYRAEQLPKATERRIRRRLRRRPLMLVPSADRQLWAASALTISFG